MKKRGLLSDAELAERGVDALLRTLGPVETVRFLAASRRRRPESVQRHRSWQRTLDKNDFFDAVFR